MPVLPLNRQNSMPQMSAAFAGWTQKINLYVITQQIFAALVVESSRRVTVNGVWQPLSPRQIAIKPEGERAWEWIDFHVQGNQTVFDIGNQIKRDGIPYKIMASKDFRLNNYTEYHLIRDYSYRAPDIDEAYLVTFQGEIVTYNDMPVTYNMPDPAAEAVTNLGAVVTYEGDNVTYNPNYLQAP